MIRRIAESPLRHPTPGGRGPSTDPDFTSCPPPPPPEPARPYGWRDDDPRTCARDDARYWNDAYDRDED